MIFPEEKITLYTHPLCPWAHRIHILLHELSIEHTSVTIDLTKPREAWYYAINPLGQIPSLTYGPTPLQESEIITDFLSSLFPSHLSPQSPLLHAQIRLFTNTFHKFLVPPLFRVLQRPLSASQLEEVGDEIVAAVEGHIAPRLPEVAGDRGVFFGGMEKVTLAEVMVAGFVMRVYLYAENGILPGSVKDRLEGMERWRRWAGEVRRLEAVKETWFEEEALGLARMLVGRANTPKGQEEVVVVGSC